MRYSPRKMIKKSRFVDFAESLNDEQLAMTLSIMGTLIKENASYCDKKNYGYLCNLFSCFALAMMLEERGKGRKESEDIVIKAMHDYLAPQVPKMKALARHRFFVPLLKKLMPLKFARVAGYGWELEFPKAPKGTFAMTTHRCIFFDIFSKYGRSELTRGFCQVDNLLYGDLPKTRFSYSERIGEGGSKCDYLFIRDDKR